METKVTTNDLIGDLKNFPIEVIEKMLQEQYKQYGEKDISIFQNNRHSEKGFRWDSTVDGHDFWNDVIRGKKFHVFFERYPKLSKNVYIHGDQNNGKKVIEELKRRGGINKYDYTGTANALYFIDPVTNYIAMAIITEESLRNILKTYYTKISINDTKTVELTMEEIAEKLGIDAELLRIKK